MFLLVKATIALLLLANFSQGLENKARYDNYRLYQVEFKTDEQVKIFQEIEERSDSYAFIGHAQKTGQNLSILVAAHKVAEFADICERFNVKCDVLTENFQEKIDAQEKTVQPKTVKPRDFDWQHYFHLESINEWLDQLAVDYKDKVTVIDAGLSYENQTIKGVKVSNKQKNNTSVFIEGGIHAREWISPATSTFLLNQLLTSKDTKVRDIAENFDWYFFPVINPDGYKYTFEGDRMWRKTRKPYDLCRGADLNRNWKVHWNESGSSPNPCRYDFAGSEAFSEPEAAAMSKFLKENARSARIQTYLSLHSYSQLLMFPYGAVKERASNYDDLLAIGKKAVEALHTRYNTTYGVGSVFETIYQSAGSSHDWVYSELQIPISYTFELRGPKNSTDMFILPAEQIEPVGLETLDAIIALLNEAKLRGYYNESMIPWNPSAATSIRHSVADLICAFIFTLIASTIFSQQN